MVWLGHTGFPYFIYLQNIVMMFLATMGSKWLAPTWTLCVEEQFYLVFPIIIMIPRNSVETLAGFPPSRF